MNIQHSQKNRRRAFRGGTTGAVQTEFMLSILTILFVIFWTWELVMAVYTFNVLSDAAKEGVRYAIVHGSGNANCSGPNVPVCPDPSGTSVVDVVNDFAQASLHDISAMTVNVTYPDSTVTPPSRVRVTVSYNFIPYIPLPWVPPLLNTAAEGRIVN